MEQAKAMGDERGTSAAGKMTEPGNQASGVAKTSAAPRRKYRGKKASKNRTKPQDSAPAAKPEQAAPPKTQQTPLKKENPVVETPKPRQQRPEPKAEKATQVKPTAEAAKPRAEKTAAKSRTEKSVAAPVANRPKQQKPAAPTASQKAAPAPKAAETLVADAEETPVVVDGKRLADMTRTVQLSIEQVLAGLPEAQGTDDAPAAQPEAAEPNLDNDDEPPTFGARLRGALASGALGTLRWLALVIFFVAIIGAAGVAWLYQGATRDAIPNINVTFGGQTLEPTAYDWEVPVVGNDFKRTYAETISPTALALAEPVDEATPLLAVSPDEYNSAVTVYDAEQKELFSGNISQFNSFAFPANGEYSAKLVLTSGRSSAGAAAAVTGSQTYHFAFRVDIRPSIRVSSQSVTQGSVLAIRVTGLQGAKAPTLRSAYQDTGFVQGTSGWVCYLPIPYDAETGPGELTVTAGGYTEKIGLTIRARNWDYKDYGSSSRMTWPFIGVDDAPDEVKELFAITDPQIYWTDSGFVQPFLSSVKVNLAFGVTEYVGRSTTQIAHNTGTGRTALNCVITTVYGDPLIAPCGGLVLLAEDLGGNAGNTLVIEHGAGLKSIFYNLKDLTVEAGEYVVQGQTVGRTNRQVIAEMRIGTVPVEPFSVWRGQCDAIKIY